MLTIFVLEYFVMYKTDNNNLIHFFPHQKRVNYVLTYAKRFNTSEIQKALMSFIQHLFNLTDKGY